MAECHKAKPTEKAAVEARRRLRHGGAKPDMMQHPTHRVGGCAIAGMAAEAAHQAAGLNGTPGRSRDRYGT